MAPYRLMSEISDETAPGMMPGAAVRSIAAEDYRLARDRGASFGRGKEEACGPKASGRRFGQRLNGEYGVVLPGDRLTSPKASRFERQRKMRQRGSHPVFRISPTEPRMIRAKLRRLAHHST
jgi:hypothetical protein